jgi:hypothetical protein
MLQLFPQQLPQPFLYRNVLRICLILIVVLAMAAGYFQVLAENRQAQYDLLRTKYKNLQSQVKILQQQNQIQQASFSGQLKNTKQ